MSGALLALGAALLCWPSPPSHVPLVTQRTAPHRLRTHADDAMPVLLAAAAFILVVAWQPSIGGALAGLGAAVGVGILLRRVRRRPVAAPDAALPLTLTVAALLLRAGSPPAAALADAARSCRSDSQRACAQVERRLRMGEPEALAWSALDGRGELAAVGRAAVRASDSGAALALAWEATGQRLRADRRLGAEVRARKVGVHVLAPLGLCFLPSFICLGVVPMVIGLAGDIL